MRRYAFEKGHGTRNDFVIVDDQHGMQELSPEVVTSMCDRRAGIGADGVLRVVKAAHIPEWDGDPDLWFMDYRNADGSLAEMCGNGLRVFALHLLEQDWVEPGDFTVATRAGLRSVHMIPRGLISVSMGNVVVGHWPKDPPVEILHGAGRWPATPVDVGNPHAVVFLDDAARLSLDLNTAPRWEPDGAFPEGVNVEFVTQRAPGELDMRVFERGSGETMSCGTGVVAAAAAHRALTGFDGPVEVRVPGGDLRVDFTDGEVWLTGPAVIAVSGEFSC
ncbi:MAG: diaminopimelate epimerase [Arachnia sp.]